MSMSGRDVELNETPALRDGAVVADATPSVNNVVADLSRNALSKLTTSAFGSIAGPIVDSYLGDLLGLGGSSGITKYLDKIEKQLEQIQDQLKQLQASVDTILAGEMAIQEKISDAELQSALGQFTIAAAQIKQIFSSYVDIVAGLGSDDAETRTLAASDLYNMLNFQTVQAIATSMTIIQEFFAPSLSEMKGLIEYQNDVLTADAFAFASNSDNYRATPPEGKYQPPCDGCWSSSSIIDQGHALIATASDSAILPTLSAFVTVQAQGLILLNTAWLHSIYERQIKSQVDAINRVLGAMHDWGTKAPGIVDDAIASYLRQYGKRLTGAITQDGMKWDYGRGDVHYNCPFNGDWLMWGTNRWQVQMVCQPWNYGGCATWMVSYYDGHGVQIDHSNDPGCTTGRFGLPPKTRAFLRPLSTQGDLYTLSSSDGSFSHDVIGLDGSLTSAASSGPLNGGSGSGIALSHDGLNAYVFAAANMIHQYAISTDGVLSPQAVASVTTDGRPRVIALSGDGRSAYLLSVGKNVISQYSVDGNGRLSAMTPATVPTGAGPSAVALTSDGRSAYVANVGDQSISHYTVGADGTLAAAGTAFGTGAQPNFIALHKSGKTAYVVCAGSVGNETGYSVWQYEIADNGMLAPLKLLTMPAATGCPPIAMALSRNGRNAYILNAAGIAQFTIQADGSLSPMSPASIAAGRAPADMALSPDGFSAFVSDRVDNAVYQFAIGGDGRLSPKSSANISAVQDAGAIAVLPAYAPV